MPVTQPDVKKSSYQQDLERRSNDLLRIYNPTDERYRVEWDRKNGTKLFPIEAKSEAVWPRYIAEKDIREMFNKMGGADADGAGRKENERRIKVGMAAMDKTLKTGEQEQFESKFYMGNDTKAKEIIALLYMGIETEFGVDTARVDEAVEQDARPAFEKAMEAVQEEKDSGVVTTAEPSSTQLKCNWPGCTYVTEHKIALFQHQKTHRPKEADTDLENKKKEAVGKVSK